jgi:hypothetical protein
MRGGELWWRGTEGENSPGTFFFLTNQGFASGGLEKGGIERRKTKDGVIPPPP